MHTCKTSIAIPTTTKLCTTSGKLSPSDNDYALHVDEGAMRAVAFDGANDADANVDLSFTYRGASHEVTAFANGAVVRQIGIKLRAQDTCNVIYVMWPVAPSIGIFVSVKSNPGMSTHEACGAGGYVPVKVTWSKPVRALREGERHSLHATLSRAGGLIRVVADGESIWEGILPASAASMHGPSGIRSDNGQFDFDFATGGVHATAPASSCGAK